jgi:hypothetical protein
MAEATGLSTSLPMLLDAAAARVLGSLVEKEVTTPEYYPLQPGQKAAYSTQSAIKRLVSWGLLPLRLEAQTSFLPSELNMGKASKSGV